MEEFPLLQGLQLYVSEPEIQSNRTFLGPNWMDDLAVCVSAATSDQLVDKLGPLVSTLLESCCNHGMTPNLSAGKTELLLGYGAKARGDGEDISSDLNMGSTSLRWGNIPASRSMWSECISTWAASSIIWKPDPRGPAKTCHSPPSAFTTSEIAAPQPAHRFLQEEGDV